MTFSAASIPSQAGRVAIVTGANSGLGFEAAKALAAKGAKVLMACRDTDKGEAARKLVEGDADVLRLDLASLASIREFTEEVSQRFESLDLLINNAGVMATPLSRTEDGFELQLGTNHLGHFALTGLLLPLLGQSPSAQIVTLSSLMHRKGKIDFDNLDGSQHYSRWGCYAQSKLANLLFAYELERRLRSTDAKVISLASHPGWTHTQLMRDLPGAGVAGSLLAMKPAQGVLPTLMAATTPEVQGGEYYGPTGLMEVWGAPGKVHSNARSHDQALAQQLWDISEQLTGVHFAL
ncbi:MAG: SDR family NAD(P)-dependent oxidoreductase [Deltaproteobacteria bacterium]|nr:SDR family NAD(P)-dependent oxidoreductase [Deltaproteobacteria bacterium]